LGAGTDAPGTPIRVVAHLLGVPPSQIVERNDPRFHEQWDRLGISFDLFTTTMTDNHREVVWDLFRTLYANGYIDTRRTEQFFDPEAGRFLPDRYVEGTCPSCGYDSARGDQCEQCGKTLDPVDLIDPRSKLTGATPEPRETEHYFILLPRLQDDLFTWLDSREGWRSHVINWAKGFVKEGLHETAITRDLAWGVPIPPELDISTEASDKRIYVWFEAVTGYLSASKEWAQRSGDPDAWKPWWEDPSAESYYFIGKDNIPFHAVFWPSYLIGYSRGSDRPLNLPTNVPANQYVTFRGDKASKSRGVGKSLLDYLDVYPVDELRYALATILPEYADTDLAEDELVRRINDELVAAWGNLVNRVLAMTRKNFDGVVPEPGELDERDHALLSTIDQVLAEGQDLLEQVELRRALKQALHGAQETNAYLNALEPWKTAKTDRDRTSTTLWTALQAINGLKLAFAPFVPSASATLDTWIGGDGELDGRGWRREQVPAGTVLGDPSPLFRKVDLDDEPT
jgi:methionyl-tRNA synthetase